MTGAACEQTPDGFRHLFDGRPTRQVRVRRHGQEAWLEEEVFEHLRDAGTTRGELWERAAAAAVAEGAAVVHVAADEPVDTPDPTIGTAAQRAGFADDRALFQLRRPLPIDADDPIRAGAPEARLRAFRPGTTDEEAWVRQNNRAFATHPDQGHQTLASLHEQMAEPWFDPEGFLVLDDEARPGELAGSCWTKVHLATDRDAALGEIYVIGVDPAHEGHGLGRTLVLAGLDHLARVGTTVGMLYVEADNEPALALYGHLGFVPHHRRRVLTRRAEEPR